MMNSRLMSSIVPADCILFELLTVIGSHRTSSAEDFKSPRRRRARVPRRQGALQRRAARRAGLADKSVIGPAQKQGPRSMQHQGGFRRLLWMGADAKRRLPLTGRGKARRGCSAQGGRSVRREASLLRSTLSE
ncbi:unnamed protein product [Prorocentrum cordatum]|uniref:Uncharacterized protein n=1 Tax=Prorocentrum cordatum TaxID=2364126 RepID=A0ABN9S935_9DINO|nr:unnamed protein product [Polarella glacialis]